MSFSVKSSRLKVRLPPDVGVEGAVLDWEEATDCGVTEQIT